MTIHIFNPETDYALASFSPYYTPPAGITALRSKMALTPLRWASAGDAILLPGALPEEGCRATPGITLLTQSDIAGFLGSHPDAVIEPWGWNPMLRHTLSASGVPSSYLPSDGWLEMLRMLSHRSTSAEFNAILNDRLAANRLSRHLSPIPLEFTDTAALLEWEKQHHPAYIKAPWSSSGRGILYTEDLDSSRHIGPWVNGIIRRQGCVIAETAAQRSLDFATEWLVSDASGRPHAEFLGVSVFKTSKRGKYHANIDAVQSRLMHIISQAAPDFGPGFIRSQQEALEELLDRHRSQDETGCHYTGYVGIDMLATPDGTIRGGVELNFRRTMGIPGPRVCIVGTGNVGSHLYSAFLQKGIDCAIVSGRSEVFPRAEVYIVCVTDSQVGHVCGRIRPPRGAIVAHTSGGVGLDAVREALGVSDAGCGVFYPLQTFTRGVPMDYSQIPFLIEGSDPHTVSELMHLASSISDNVAEADSEMRGRYHVAAVLACNFTNHLCTLADEYLGNERLDFRMLLPLMNQTVAKLSGIRPADAQTGPAVRGDMPVIASHLDRLREYPTISEIYRLLSRSIINHHNKSESNE